MTRLLLVLAALPAVAAVAVLVGIARLARQLEQDERPTEGTADVNGMPTVVPTVPVWRSADVWDQNGPRTIRFTVPAGPLDTRGVWLDMVNAHGHASRN